MHIALYEPEIPGNTGSIGRVCVGTATTLHLIGKLGFSIDEAAVRRAGLDYWPKVQLRHHAHLADFLAAIPGQRVWAFTAHGSIRYDQIAFRPDDVLLFGGESRGLPPEVRAQFAGHEVFVPTTGDIRSLNLANCATLVLFEALRQQGFAGLRGG